MRFPEFKEEWEKFPITKFLELKNGLNTNSENFGRGVKYISVMDILNNHYINYDNVIGYVDVDIDTQRRYAVNYGDILFQRSSETMEDVGRSNVYLDSKPAIFGGFVIRGKKIGDYNPIFFKFLLDNPNTRKKIIVKGAGSQRYNIGQDALSEISLYFPITLEQQKIANFLSLLDQRITTQNKIIEQYKSLMKGLNEILFSQETRFKDKNRKKFPEWRVERLGEISTITTGSSNRVDSVLDGEFVFFDRSQDIRTSNRYLFDKEAIIIPGEGQEFIPKYYIGKFDLHQRTYAIFNFIGGIGRYLYYYISYNNKYLLSQAVGSTVKSLRLPIFQSMAINLPCIEEQTLIAVFLSSIDKKIETEKQLLDQLGNQKRYLLQNIFI